MNIIALSIPTGIGAEIGGYAGDAGAVAREFSKYFKVILNPNVVNAGLLSAINENMYYTEGYAFDEFFNGKINLKPLCGEDAAGNEGGDCGDDCGGDCGGVCRAQNRIGVIFDKAIPNDILNLHLNTIDAMKIVKGYDIPYYAITEDDVGVRLLKDNSGVSTGVIENEGALYFAAEKLIKKGCNAIAVVCYFNDECEDENYNEGCGVDPIGGIEAVISHYIAKEFMVPCAHSPAFSGLDITFKKVNYKVASEFISSTYLPCILDGLSMAPGFISAARAGDEPAGGSKSGNTAPGGGPCGAISRDEVKCLIVPDGALGSKAVLSCIERGIQICAVKNQTVLSIDCKKFKKNDIIKGNGAYDIIRQFSSYQECLNFIRKEYE